jgi:hypothetical protein
MVLSCSLDTHIDLTPEAENAAHWSLVHLTVPSYTAVRTIEFQSLTAYTQMKRNFQLNQDEAKVNIRKS